MGEVDRMILGLTIFCASLCLDLCPWLSGHPLSRLLAQQGVEEVGQDALGGGGAAGYASLARLHLNKRWSSMKNVSNKFESHAI